MISFRTSRRESADRDSVLTVPRDRFELAVCRYEFHRGGAGNVFEHWEIRDLYTMHRTIDHVQSRWMTKRMIAHCEPAGYVQVCGVHRGILT